MPYTPSQAKKKYPWMSDKQAEIFSKAFDSAMKQYKSESKAFAVALAAAKKEGDGQPKKSSKEPTFVKMREVFKNKKNPENPSLVENKDNYADTKKPFPEDINKQPEAKKSTLLKKENSMEKSVNAHLAYLAGKNVEPKTASQKTAGPLLERLQQQEGEGQSKIQQTLSQLKGAFDKFRSLVFEVAPTGQVIEAAKSGEGVDLKIYPDKDSPTPSTEKKFDLNSFVNFFFQKIAPQNAEKVLSEIISKGFSSIAKPVFARVCASIKKAQEEETSKKKASFEYVEKAPYYIPDLDENDNELPTGELSEEPMFLVNKTYEIVTPESAEQGDAEDRGFVFEDKKMSPEDLASEIRNENYSEWSSSDKTGWITAYDEDGDFRTGERTNYSLHFKKLDGSELTSEDYDFIDHLMNN